MAFKKAKAEQAFLKVGIYGPPGSGKTFTTLLCSEGLATNSKRIAFVDTERGTDFYSQAIKDRAVHPAAFDFDAIYTRSITDVLAEVKALDLSQYAVVVIDSITHLWESTKQAYAGKLTRAGTIPFTAWGSIKKPYKELMTLLLNMPAHVFILGRQGNEFEEDETTGELKKTGVKMKAEGETPYEPHILLCMEATRNKDGSFTPTVTVDKDRTGILMGKTFRNPTFNDLVAPLLGYLGATQAKTLTDEETGQKDADVLAAEESAKLAFSAETVREFTARFDLAKTAAEAEAVGKLITAELKKKMTAQDVDLLSEKFHESTKRLKGA